MEREWELFWLDLEIKYKPLDLQDPFLVILSPENKRYFVRSFRKPPFETGMRCQLPVLAAS
jgi:hypothetical protein